MRRSMRGVLPCAAVVAIVAAVLGVRAEGRQPGKRAEFMRMKLEYSKNVLEGLTVEDYDEIAKNAKALRLMSRAAEWEVRTIPNAGDYVVLTSEFQRHTDDLSKAAQAKNLDAATLAYLRLTMNCVNCHKYSRGLAR
jgi:hypothetical protein